MSKNEKILKFEFICAYTQNDLSFTQMFEFTQKHLMATCHELCGSTQMMLNVLHPYTGIWQYAINDFVKDYIEIMATKSDKYINFDQINK